MEPERRLMGDRPVQTLTRGWGPRLADFVQSARRELTICAPFLSRAGTGLVTANLSDSLRTRGRLICLTDLSPLAACQGATEPWAIRDMTVTFAHAELIHLPRLHAKVYIADGCRAIITSGNLTAGGLFQNYEYGVLSEDTDLVKVVADDLRAYAEPGATLDTAELDRYCEVIGQARSAFGKDEAARSSGRAFRAAIRKAEDELIRSRLRGGAVHSVFARTVLYLLKRHGPMSTEEIHLLVEQIHPDLCNNSVDRVIDGKRFGKKWKHAVRTAQQQLKRRGEIELRGEEWVLR